MRRVKPCSYPERQICPGVLDVRGTGQTPAQGDEGLECKEKRCEGIHKQKIWEEGEKEGFRTKNVVSSNMEGPAREIRERRIMKAEGFRICLMYRAAQGCAELLSAGTV